jgi:putative heme iron utilization protein
MTGPQSPLATCRDLVSRARFAALATLAEGDGRTSAEAGWPFASLVALADDGGRPLLLLSRLAEHTKNLERCGRASLLVTDKDAAEVDPLAAARVTILGTCARVPEVERALAASKFLSAHPGSAEVLGFGDFALWRLEVARLRWVGGFGRMGWLSASEYLALEADPEAGSGAYDAR